MNPLSHKDKFGQFFTPKPIAEFMVAMADIHKDTRILEPSCGEGVFLQILEEQGFTNYTAFEVDKSLNNPFANVQYKSFVTAEIEQQFDVIIGNPPYIRWKNLDDSLKNELLSSPTWLKYANALGDYLYIFIIKSIQCLKQGGQLIFICPEYWITTTHAQQLRDYMVEQGYFEQIYHFNETPIFEKVATSTVIFKFVKGKANGKKIALTKYYSSKKLTPQLLNSLQQQATNIEADYLTLNQFEIGKRWFLYDDNLSKRLDNLTKNCHIKNNCQRDSYTMIGDVCDIGNGMVSGLDKAFQLTADDVDSLTATEKNALLPVIKAKHLQPYIADTITPYIFVQASLDEAKFAIAYPHFYQKLFPYKQKLAVRYQYNRKIEFWQWVFLRNYQLFSKPQKRIFVPCKERISHKDYFRFALVEAGIYPTQDVTAIFCKETTKESIEYILAYLNLPIVFDWLRTKGIVKGSIVEFSEKPLASIPFRAIDWDNPQEVAIHDTITQFIHTFIKTQKSEIIAQIQKLFKQLMAD